MYENFFAERLSALRNQKNVSAREMSLAIGQNSSYINRIENRHAFPSMQNFFYICEYLGISPQEFFDPESRNPKKLQAVWKELQKLDDTQLDALLTIIKGLQKK